MIGKDGWGPYGWAGGKNIPSRRSSIIKSTMLETSKAFAIPQGRPRGAQMCVVVHREIV